MSHYISLKKMHYNSKDGFLRLQLLDNFYNVVYDKTVALKDKAAMKELLFELKSKGFENIFEESSWF